MARYFIEVAYMGCAYSGFQVQENAGSIQEELQKALAVLHRRSFLLTGSSRTDAGVHARQNYFHFDDAQPPHAQAVYKLNAILPPDIAVKRIVQVSDEAHCRFHAEFREYKYYIYRAKDPFLNDRAYFFPYPLNLEWLNMAAERLKTHANFQTFSKRNTQVKTFECQLFHSQWNKDEHGYIYTVRGNRFLRGMVRGLVGTMLQVGRGKIGIDRFEEIILSRDCTLADFSAPAHGLFLSAVHFPEETLPAEEI